MNKTQTYCWKTVLWKCKRHCPAPFCRSWTRRSPDSRSSPPRHWEHSQHVRALTDIKHHWNMLIPFFSPDTSYFHLRPTVSHQDERHTQPRWYMPRTGSSKRCNLTVFQLYCQEECEHIFRAEYSDRVEASSVIQIKVAARKLRKMSCIKLLDLCIWPVLCSRLAGSGSFG